MQIRSLLPLLIACAAGCSPAKTQPPVALAERPTSGVIEGTGWSMRVPANFDVETSPAHPVVNDVMKIELIISSRSDYGSRKMFSAVAFIDWRPEYGDVGNFPSIAAAMLIKAHGDGVISAERTSFRGRPASLVYYVASGNEGVLQLSVAAGGRGYLLRCGGDNNNIDEIANVCKGLIATFSLVDD